MKYSNMKFSRQWGSGKIFIRENITETFARRTHSGASGSVLGNGRMYGGFCLKLVKLLDDTGEVRSLFWQEAASVSLYTSSARDIPACVTCPIPAHYWIHKDDPLYRNFRETAGGTLNDFISLFGVNCDQLLELGIEPADYRYIPAELLNNIYRDNELAEKSGKYLPGDLHQAIFDQRIKADILLTYPIWKGDVSVDKIAGRLHADDICKMIYQILNAILALYHSGMAHGDIKPANIMSMHRHNLNPGISRQRDYFLTDIGCIHSGTMPSCSGTQNFFNFAVYSLWEKETSRKAKSSKNAAYRRQNERFTGSCSSIPAAGTPEELNSLLRRTLMDGYALAAAVWSLAYGREPLSSSLNRRVVINKWNDPHITDIFDILYDVKNLSIEKMQNIVDVLAGSFSFGKVKSPAFRGLTTHGKESEFRFTVVSRIDENIPVHTSAGMRDTDEKNLIIEYGYIPEQFNCSGNHNFLVRCNRKSLFPKLPEDAVQQPLITAYSNGDNFVNSIYYAPDDIETGSRITADGKYTPYTLDHILSCGKPADADVEELLQLAELIDKENDRARRCTPLPYPCDIARINGKWMIQPFCLGSMEQHEYFSMQEYFKMLCGQRNSLTAQNWIDLLYYDNGVGILYNLIPQDMVSETAGLINSKLKEKLYPDDNEQKRIRNFLHSLAGELKKTRKFGKYFSDLPPFR